MPIASWPRRRGDEAGLKDLLVAYEDEGSAQWLYTRALLAFREGRVREDEVVRLVKDAWSANEHVPAILAGTASPVFSDGDYITVGGPDEATEYVAECGLAWRHTRCHRVAKQNHCAPAGERRLADG
jgi:hypothetical protein